MTKRLVYIFPAGSNNIPVLCRQHAPNAYASHSRRGRKQLTAPPFCIPTGTTWKNLGGPGAGCRCEVNVYTINTPAELALARTAGVDGIFTDFPDLPHRTPSDGGR